jgi:hypothetical protein
MFAGCTAAALVVLAARAIAYALVPRSTLLSVALEHSAGGPRLPVVTGVALGCAVLAAAAVVGFAALAVGERLALERAPVISPPRIRPWRLARRSACLLAATTAAFALLESYLHWRAGLGWHGLRCLTGPVHRDALPILAALSLLAGALLEAVEHLVAWARRSFARLLRRLRRQHPPERRRSIAARPSGPRRPGAALPARGPPAAPGRLSAARAASAI